MTRTLRWPGLLPGLWLSILLFATPQAWAEADDLFALTIHELANVSVSSTSYFDEDILDAANSVSYRDRGNWQETGARNLSDVLNTLPSTVAPAAYGNSQPLAIRGYYSYTSNLGIAVRFDDIPMNQLSSGSGLSPLNGYDLNTLHSMELIRGPGSALHGAGAFHGTLSLYSATANSTDSEVSLQAGTEAYRSASVKLFETGEKLDTVAILAHTATGDQSLAYPYTDPLTQQPRSGERSYDLENTNFLLKLSNDPYGETRYYASLYLLEYDADQLIGTGNEFGNSYQTDQDWSQTTNSIQIAKLGLSHPFSTRHSLETFVYYWQDDDQFQLDLLRERDVLRKSERQERHWGVQITDQLQFQQRSKLVYGYEFRYAEVDKFVQYNEDRNGNINRIPVEEQIIEETLNSFIIDGRYTFPTRSNDTDVVYSLRLDDFDRFDLQSSPRLGLIHYLDNASVVKLTVAQAYRRPTPREQVRSNGIAANPSLEPEQINNIEFIYQWYTAHWFSGITLFQSQWKHAIGIRAIAIPGIEEEFQFQNKGNNEAHGVEFETQGHWDQWRLDINASYLQSKNEDSGIDYEAFPDWMLNLGIGYQLQQNVDVYSMTSFHHRRSASVSNLFGNTNQESAQYFRTDIVLSWKINAVLDTRFSINNLFDQENYYPSYFGHQKGIPDKGINATVALDWQL